MLTVTVCRGCGYKDGFEVGGGVAPVGSVGVTSPSPVMYNTRTSPTFADPTSRPVVLSNADGNRPGAVTATGNARERRDLPVVVNRQYCRARSRLIGNLHIHLPGRHIVKRRTHTVDRRRHSSH